MSASSFGIRRESLAQRAALCSAAGRDTAPLLPALRRLTTAELLAAPGAATGAVDLGGAVSAVCRAAEQAVRRRGWLDVGLCEAPLPVHAPARLLQAAVLAVLRGALLCNAAGSVRCFPLAGSAVLCLRGGSEPAATALLRHLGGQLLLGANAPFTAILRLPLAQGAPTKTVCRAEDLLADRYSVLYQYLEGFCAGPEE